MKNKNLLIISCGSLKRDEKQQAQTLYNGSYFKAQLNFAKSLKDVDRIMILSGKYGLIDLETEIEPYDQKLPLSFRFSEADLKILSQYNIYILTGSRYYKIVKKQVDVKLSFLELYYSQPQSQNGIGLLIQWLNLNRGKSVFDFFDHHKINWNFKE